MTFMAIAAASPIWTRNFSTASNSYSKLAVPGHTSKPITIPTAMFRILVSIGQLILTAGIPAQMTPVWAVRYTGPASGR